MGSPRILLEAHDLGIGYAVRGRRKIVAENMAFRLEGGRFACLLGPNGSGKSTLLRTLAGIQPPLSGTIRINGGDARTLSPAHRARCLGLVLTDRMETGNLTVRDLAALGRAPHTGWLGRLSGRDEERVAWALRTTGSHIHAARRVGELSDGERQKAMIARVLAQETPVIILDEPTAHLDLPNRVGMMRLLKNLARETRKAILLSTHELDLALQAADQVWLMDQGGGMRIGTPEDLILDGTFAAVFAKDGCDFDPSTGTFRFHEPGEVAIALIGSGPSAFWTRRALEREGFRVTASAHCGRKVEILEEENGSFRWIAELDGSVSRYGSVRDLIRALTAETRAGMEAAHG